MGFRSDINGLRAYAVLAVIVFHFDKLWLPGGFAGVDVFFVISGYLMTSIIFRGLEADNFSVLDFYSARVRRIIPALLFLVLLLLCGGYFSLAPIPYAALAKHSESSLLFISNFVYWQEAGYFDASALEKFLLHTWSLSTEWQFYLVYPLVLWGASKVVSVVMLKRIILLSAFIAFVGAVYLSYQWPTASYFLLPARIWEMLWGGVAFLFPLRLPTKKIFISMMEVLGIGLILLSFFVVSEHSVWPGYGALLPVFGTFLVLQSASNSFLTNNVIFQKVGLWSYSMYLWHWPILVVNHLYEWNLNFFVFLLITLLLSLLSYHLIEKRRWQVSTTVWLAVAVVLGSYFGVHQTNGASYRVPPEYSLSAKDYHAKYYGGSNYPTHKQTVFNVKPDESYDYVLIGDSFARQYVSYLVEQKVAMNTWFADGCILLPNYTQSHSGKAFELCQQQSNQIFHDGWLLSLDKPVIWAQNWQGYELIHKKTPGKIITYASSPKQYEEILGNELKEIFLRYSYKTFFIVGVVSPASYNVYNCKAEQFISWWKDCKEFSSKVERPINKLLEAIADEFDNVNYISPNEVLCDGNNCRDIVNGSPIFSDLSHLSIYGARIVGEYIMYKIKESLP